MAFAANASHAPVFKVHFDELVEHIKTYFARRAEYNRTVSELARLDDRELADIGMTRYTINEVAYQSVFRA